MNNPLLILRQRLIAAPLLSVIRKVLPPISDTERDALEAGTVSWDAQLFSGKPQWQKLLGLSTPRLSEEEQAFIDGPVQRLCEMVDDWRVNHELVDLPPEVWRFIKEQRFLGIIIPRRYGGLGFSAVAHSQVIAKIATRSVTAAVTVMVPNSLGPAELLLEYGTEAQKEHYLPRLARGEELPCFAMTGPTAGSDAASMPDRGIVCRERHNGMETLGMRVSWDKRYITLGPVATLLGLAFRLYDPDHLLGEQEDLGITLALVPTDTPGVHVGRRHYPSRQAFQNGPTRGEDVFFPTDWVIGGKAQIGRGWRMLMECLSAARGISLPSMSAGAAMLCARTTGAYARVRKQFGIPIGKFEGVQEVLAPIAGNCYLLDAARRLTTTIIDGGEKPSVITAIVKYHATTRMRETVNLAMDIYAGKGVSEGPRNFLANVYHALPVAITVEGANLLTRNLIIFGQGAIRCHPYLLKEMEAARDDDHAKALVDFDRALFSHLAHSFKNLGRCLFHNLTGGRFAYGPEAGPVTTYYRQLSRASASFAWLAECALLALGGAIKRKEMLSARFGDVLSEMYLLSAVLKRFEDEERQQADLPLVQWCAGGGLYAIERAFDAILVNFPSRPLAWLLRLMVFPFGRRRRPPSDALNRRCAKLLLEPCEARERLTRGMFISDNPDDALFQLEAALNAVIAADPIRQKLKGGDDRGRRSEQQPSGSLARMSTGS